MDYKHNLLYDNMVGKGNILKNQNVLKDAYEKGRGFGEENDI